MTLLIASAVLWILLHRLVSGGPLRSRLVASIGAQAYQALFALLSASSLALLAIAYAHARVAGGVAALPAWVMVAVASVQLFATILVVFGLSTVNPTTAGLGGSVRNGEIVRGVLRVTRHPFLWGIMLWAAAHVVVRPNLPNIVFFGAIGFVAAAGTLSIDRKRAAVHGAEWQAFARRTSSLPFLAIARGRQRLAFGEISLVRVVIGIVLWAAMLAVHPWISGGAHALPWRMS